jgi:putative transposase
VTNAPQPLQRGGEAAGHAGNGAGKTINEVIRRHGIAEATYYRWRAAFHPAPTHDEKAMRQLEDQNRQLRDICAESAVEIRLLKQEIARLRRENPIS